MMVYQEEAEEIYLKRQFRNEMWLEHIRWYTAGIGERWQLTMSPFPVPDFNRRADWIDTLQKSIPHYKSDRMD